MPQGIRRTNLMQARTEDPFEALLRTDAQRMARNQQSEESLLAREAKRGMFDEEMEMKGSQFDRKFAETQMQNAASRANAAARLGLARSAAGTKDPDLWLKKARYKHGSDMELAKLKNKRDGLGGKGSGYQNTAIYKNMDADAQGRMDADFAAYVADPNVGYKDATSKVLGDAGKSVWANPFEDTFYYD